MTDSKNAAETTASDNAMREGEELTADYPAEEQDELEELMGNPG